MSARRAGGREERMQKEKEKIMIDLDLPTEQEQLDQVIQSLARTARSTGLDVAGGLLEALRDLLTPQSARQGR